MCVSHHAANPVNSRDEFPKNRILKQSIKNNVRCAGRTGQSIGFYVRTILGLPGSTQGISRPFFYLSLVTPGSPAS
jgi:hypothetical protein